MLTSHIVPAPYGWLTRWCNPHGASVPIDCVLYRPFSNKPLGQLDLLMDVDNRVEHARQVEHAFENSDICLFKTIRSQIYHIFVRFMLSEWNIFFSTLGHLNQVELKCYLPKVVLHKFAQQYIITSAEVWEHLPFGRVVSELYLLRQIYTSKSGWAVLVSFPNIY